MTQDFIPELERGVLADLPALPPEPEDEPDAAGSPEDASTVDFPDGYDDGETDSGQRGHSGDDAGGQPWWRREEKDRG